MAVLKSDVEAYLNETKSVVLATVDENGIAQVRHLGGYGVDGVDVYLSTAADSDKVKQIRKNAKVTLLFHKEGQQAPNLKNITIFGEAEIISETGFDQAADIIRLRRPQAQLNAKTNAIIHVKAKKIKALDFTAQDKVLEVSADELE